MESSAISILLVRMILVLRVAVALLKLWGGFCFRIMASASSRKRANEQNVQGLLGVNRVRQQGPQPPQRPSQFAKALLHRYFWGELSAATVQHLAAAVVEDGGGEEVVVALSQVGTQGAHSGSPKGKCKTYSHFQKEVVHL